MSSTRIFDCRPARALLAQAVLACALLAGVPAGAAPEPNRPLHEALNQQSGNLPPYGQSSQAICGFPATATAAPLLRVCGALCILLATLILFGRVLTLRGPTRAAAGH